METARMSALRSGLIKINNSAIVIMGPRPGDLIPRN